MASQKFETDAAGTCVDSHHFPPFFEKQSYVWNFKTVKYNILTFYNFIILGQFQSTIDAGSCLLTYFSLHRERFQSFAVKHIPKCL